MNQPNNPETRTRYFLAIAATVEAPVQRIKGRSVLRDPSESTPSTLCALFFIMSGPGYPKDGVHYISVHNLWVGHEKVPGVDNIVINNHKTPFYFRWLHNNPSTFEISLGPHGYTDFVQHDKEWVNVKGGYQQWVLRPAGTDTYLIELAQDPHIVWTDLGPGSAAHRQIQLKPFLPGNAAQLFRIK
ncbi:hypothetical protein SCLCIDRAFT_1216610 [Scleroderma citrinum Foug A]|uniref:Ricin B lectin domain-containing protein n=1 Tax=Scleroderma citrinum Foug A TaxID=1036808 RepID=A0A0C2ZGC9_9AGAM|nr:hypothetical protein SCLCIDRAFT_1216610 [Scleroderma citrinum Foug A]